MLRIAHHKLPPIIADSGTFGFYGEGYWWHKMAWPFVIWLKWFGTFVSKTVTAKENEGNMPLTADGRPKEWFPKCIFIDWKRWLKGGMLNAVGLSNFGIIRHLASGLWQKRRRIWMMSFMPIGKTLEEQLEECRAFAEAVRGELRNFRAQIVIVLNISCPNKGKDQKQLAENVGQMLDIIYEILGQPIVVKVAVDMPVKQAGTIGNHPHCMALHVSNTVHFGKLPGHILKRVFSDMEQGEDGKPKSPLDHFGGGGFSGKDLLPYVLEWIQEAHRQGFSKPIIGGGGVFTPLDVWKIKGAGASAVAVASPLILRPFWVPFNVLTAWILFRD